MVLYENVSTYLIKLNFLEGYLFSFSAINNKYYNCFNSKMSYVLLCVLICYLEYQYILYIISKRKLCGY